MIHNGRTVVTIQTRHGCFRWARLRFRDTNGQEVRLFGQSVSSPLRSLALRWVNALSFGAVSRLIEEVSGQDLLSEDGLWRLVQSEATRLDAMQAQEIEEDASWPEPVSEPAYVAALPEQLYDPAAIEFVTMTDGIGVKAQKPTRDKAGEPKKAKEEKRHETDVLILPRQNGGETVICEGVSGKWSLVEAARAFLKREWTGKVLTVVALTDGAKSIRADLAALFGEGVKVILDWYHLQKRVYQQLSMAAHSMREREEWEIKVLGLLWHGNITSAKEFLGSVKVRNARAMADLIGYLDKHSSEIIDYERRQKAGKVIGSGRMEKCVDQVVGHRQKGKGMSWTKAGTRALALLKAAQLNARPTTGAT